MGRRRRRWHATPPVAVRGGACARTRTLINSRARDVAAADTRHNDDTDDERQTISFSLL